MPTKDAPCGGVVPTRSQCRWRSKTPKRAAILPCVVSALTLGLAAFGWVTEDFQCSSGELCCPVGALSCRQTSELAFFLLAWLGFGGKAEASLNGAAFGVAGTVGSLLAADSSCARLLVAALTFAGVVGLGLLFCVTAAAARNQ